MVSAKSSFVLRVTAVQITLLLLIFQVLLCTPAAFSHQDDAAQSPPMTHDMTAPASSKVAKAAADKRESEFNHHLAGFLVILAGIFLLLQDRLAARWPLARYVWPTCFLAAGLFLLVFSDTEIWPFGAQTPWFALTHNLEVLQHKIFAIILLALGYVELRRTGKRIKAPWAPLVFPVVAAAGAVLLLFHVHSGDMEVPHAMETMERVQQQHRWFASAGMGVALTSLLAEVPQKWRTIFKYIWPALLVVLGVLLMLYAE